jgi:hypothetical protein
MKGMNIRYGHLMVALLLPSAVMAQDNNDPDNPFFYAPEKKVEVGAAGTAPIIIQNPELSEQQRETVKNMLSDALMSISPEFARKETNAAILESDETYVGITSGMHLIYNASTQKFRYIDSKKHKEVLTQDAFNKRVEITKGHIADVVNKVVGEMPKPQEGNKPNLLDPAIAPAGKSGIKPIEIKGN